MKYQILLIDDDQKIGDTLKEYFALNHLTLKHCLDPIEGIELAKKEQPEIILLDIMLPNIDGFETCRRLKQDTKIPVLMLTARGEPIDRVVGLEIGAEDYLSKPFEPRELLIRVQNILKRNQATSEAEAQTEEILNFKDLRIECHLRRVELNGHELELTTAEYQLLYFLAKNPLKNVSRDEIMNALKGIEVEIYSRSVDIAVSRLRKKIAPLDYIRTVWGSGYSFVPEYEKEA